MRLQEAAIVAQEYKDILTPACTRIEIVGSVKRADKLEVHDIELLMILNGARPVPAFGNPHIYNNRLEKILDELLADHILRIPKRKANGERYKKFAIVEHSQLNEFCLDCFIVSESTWGIQNVIRTGPSLFSHCYVTNRGITFYDERTNRRYAGLLPLQYKYIKGETRIEEHGQNLPLPEEADALNLLGHGWIEPGERREYIKVAV